jgi:HK97 family phage prohead protease
MPNEQRSGQPSDRRAARSPSAASSSARAPRRQHRHDRRRRGRRRPETVIGSGFWAFREMIMPGAFKDAIKNSDVRALFNHDPNLLLGRTESGTLRIKEDKAGLRYDVDLPDTVTGRDVQTLIKRGDVSRVELRLHRRRRRRGMGRVRSQERQAPAAQDQPHLGAVRRVAGDLPGVPDDLGVGAVTCPGAARVTRGGSQPLETGGRGGEDAGRQGRESARAAIATAKAWRR